MCHFFMFFTNHNFLLPSLQELNIWAYPTVPNQYKDEIVCCIRENPEPVVFKVCCDAFRPELDLDRKQLIFDKVLLHRLENSLFLVSMNIKSKSIWFCSIIDLIFYTLQLNLFITWFFFGYNTDECWSPNDHFGLIFLLNYTFTLVITQIG